MTYDKGYIDIAAGQLTVGMHVLYRGRLWYVSALDRSERSDFIHIYLVDAEFHTIDIWKYLYNPMARLI